MAIIARDAEIKPGYKLTEVGMIPEDWKVKELAELTTLLTNGFVGKATDFYTDSDDGVLYIQGFNVEENSYNFTGIKRVTTEFHRQHSKSHLLEGDLLTIQTGEIGLTTIVPKELEGSNCHALIISRFNRNLDPKYFSYYFNSSNGRARFKDIETGTTMKHLNVGDLHTWLVPFPPTKTEQSAIATTLSNVDALITSLDKLIAKKCDIKQATMQQLLTGKMRLPGFSKEAKQVYKQTDFGMVPADWRIMSLGLLSAFITKGTTPTTYGFSWAKDGVLFLRSECVSEQGLDLTQSMFITPEAHNILRRGEVQTGDILITITGNVGRVVYLNNGFGIANINQHIARIRILDTNVDAGYVFHFLSLPTVRKYYNSIVTGQAYPQISLKQVRDTRIPMPPTKSEQTAIATVLSDMDAEIAALEQKRDKIRVLKQGMMQELLTGKTRLL